MTDKELLELAAKAAGIEWRKDWLAYLNEEGLKWNPLGDDGDAFRLAVKLELIPSYMRFSDMHIKLYSPEEKLIETRRAIVRAAAEIGREE